MVITCLVACSTLSRKCHKGMLCWKMTLNIVLDLAIAVIMLIYMIISSCSIYSSCGCITCFSDSVPCAIDSCQESVCFLEKDFSKMLLPCESGQERIEIPQDSWAHLKAQKQLTPPPPPPPPRLPVENNMYTMTGHLPFHSTIPVSFH